MLMATGADYTISLPFKTLEHPERTAYDEGPHDIELLFTLDAEMFDGEPDEEDVQNTVDECFCQVEGALEDFGVTGTTMNASGTFDVILSGSQPGITYHLTLNGKTVMTMTGTGLPLTFKGLTKSGVYSIVAEYGNNTHTMTDTFIYSRTKLRKVMIRKSIRNCLCYIQLFTEQLFMIFQQMTRNP